MIDYVLELNESVIIYQGIRKDESDKRSLMDRSCRYFKFYFEPYASNEITIAKFKEKPPTTHKQKLKLIKAEERLAAGFKDEKYYTYRKQDVFKFCSSFADDVIRPFIDATGDEVIYFSLNRGYQINPLYYRGASRVGCFPCKNATIPEITLIAKEFPETIAKIKNAEHFVKGTFFAPDYIPARYLTGWDPKSEKKICFIEDVIRYVNDKTVQHTMLEDLGFQTKCKSVYAICE